MEKEEVSRRSPQSVLYWASLCLFHSQWLENLKHLTHLNPGGRSRKWRICFPSCFYLIWVIEMYFQVFSVVAFPDFFFLFFFLQWVLEMEFFFSFCQGSKLDKFGFLRKNTSGSECQRGQLCKYIVQWTEYKWAFLNLMGMVIAWDSLSFFLFFSFSCKDFLKFTIVQLQLSFLFPHCFSLPCPHLFPQSIHSSLSKPMSPLFVFLCLLLPLLSPIMRPPPPSRFHLVTVSLFFISKSLVIFCSFVCFVD